MRLSKDPIGWHADGVRRRDFRADPHGTPEVPQGHPKRKHPERSKYYRPKKVKPACKHVWVEVDWREYRRYREGQPSFYWYRESSEWYERIANYTRFFVCPSCDDTKSKHDRGKYRYWCAKKYPKRTNQE